MEKVTILIICITIGFVSCKDDTSGLIDSRTKLLIDTYWDNSETIGNSPSGYSVISPIIFNSDGNVYIGGYSNDPFKWEFINGGNSIKINYTQTFKTWEIIELSESTLHFEEYSDSGDLIIELIYQPR